MSITIGSREIVAEPRPLPPPTVRFLVPVLSLVVGILVGGATLLAAGHDPAEAFNEVLNKGFLGKLPLIGTLVLATPLILTGLAAVVSFRMKIWNIGAEGQLLIGGIAGSGTALALGEHLPGPLVIVIALLASVAA